jgi:SSS family solute:Na+ symporter
MVTAVALDATVPLMLTSTIGYAALGVTLAVFAWIGFRAGRGSALTRDNYLAARGTQGGSTLALSLFASGMGVWILFAPPEVGAELGGVAVVGYAVAAATPLVVFAWLGPRLRARHTDGVSLTDWVRHRFGRTFEAYVAAVTAFYMFMFLTAELTAIGGVFGLLAGIEPEAPIIAIAAVTVAYTAYGGLPASLRTDRWQGWLILGLAAIAAVSVLVDVSDPLQTASDGGLTDGSRAGFESALALIIAVTAANLFHTGYWQRIWSARDDAALIQGCLRAAALTAPIVALAGLAGILAAGRPQGVEVPALAIFDLVGGLPDVVLAVVLVLALALVASSVDTLENGMVALVCSDVTGGRVSLTWARVLTIALTVPAVWIAVQGYSVLRLFLIADLVAAATILPVLSGLGRRVDGRGAFAGSAAGLAAVVVVGWVTQGSIGEGFELLTLPRGVELAPFFWALVTSGAVALLWPSHRVEAGRRPGHSRSANDRSIVNEPPTPDA